MIRIPLIAALLLLLVAAAALAAGCGQPPPPNSHPNVATVPGPPAVRQHTRAVPAPNGSDRESKSDGQLIAGGAKCGRARWDVKTASDPAAANITVQPRDTTIAAVNALPSTNTGDPNQPRQPPFESQVWRVQGTLVEARGESDSDIHLVLADQQGNHLGAEIPDAPACTEPPITGQVSRLEPQIEHARDAFVQEFGLPAAYPAKPLQIGKQVTVTGVGFFDFGHGQVGAAQNYAELHPLLSIQDP